VKNDAALLPTATGSKFAGNSVDGSTQKRTCILSSIFGNCGLSLPANF